jgi:hypothetical protein
MCKPRIPKNGVCKVNYCAMSPNICGAKARCIPTGNNTYRCKRN